MWPAAPKADLVRALGADQVVDHTPSRTSPAPTGAYDPVIVDIAGTRRFSELRRVLTPHATVVVVGGPRANRLLGPLGHVIACRLAALFASQKATFFIAKLNETDTETLRELLEAGKLRSVVDSVYPLERIADALTHQGDGHPGGKIVVTIPDA